MPQKRRGHNEGSIYRRQDGQWCASVTVGQTATGAAKRRVIYGSTRKEVQEALIKLLADAQKGLPIDPSRQTVRAFLEEWLQNSVRGSVAERTLNTYRQAVQHVLPTLGDVPLAKLTPQHLQRLYREKQDAGLTRTVTLMHSTLHRALGQATEWGLVPRNVASLVKRPKVETREFHVLNLDQANQLLAAAEGDRLHALYVLALTCGLRQGELLGIQWTDLDLEARRLTVRRQLAWLKDGPTFTELKSAKGRRTMPLSTLAVSALRKHRVQQLEARLALGEAWEEHGLVFTTAIGTPLCPSHLRNRSFTPLLVRAGLPPVRFHDLRHTAATLLLAQGVHPRLVQEQLGHARVNITLDTYSHVTAPMMEGVANVMDALLSGRKRSQ